MAKVDFVNQLRLLGFIPQEPSVDKVYFEWIVPNGKNISKKILIGFVVNNDFPMNCPTGPHIKAIDATWIEHPQNIHDWQFGHNWEKYPDDKELAFYQQGWRYWSRPCLEWNNSDKTVKFYLSHIRKIMETV